MYPELGALRPGHARAAAQAWDPGSSAAMLACRSGAGVRGAGDPHALPRETPDTALVGLCMHV